MTELARPLLCLALLFFFIAHGIDGFRLRPYRDGRQKEGTVVAAHAGMTPNDLEKEEQTHLIAPRLRSGTVQLFGLATIGAFVQSNFTHEDSTITSITSRSAVVLGITPPAAALLPDLCNWQGWPRTVSSAPGSVSSGSEESKVVSCFRNRIAWT